MSQNFYIKKGSMLPYLRMELIKDGRHDFNSFYELLQNSEVFFSMKNIETGIYLILNKKADVVYVENTTCTEEYIIEYKWDKKDTLKKGIYKGEFNIVFDDNERNENLIVPIQEELLIYII